MSYVLTGYAVTLASLLLYSLRLVARERSLRRAATKSTDVRD